MSQQALLERITADAEAAIAAINAEADATIAQIEAEAAVEVAAVEAAVAATSQKQQERQALILRSQAKQAANLAVQSAKRNQIDALIAQVSNWVAGLSGEAYVAFYQTQYHAAVPESVAVTAVTVPAGKAADTTALLTALGISAPTTEDPALTGGLVVTASDGVYDLSFNRLMKDRRETLEAQIVAKILS